MAILYLDGKRMKQMFGASAKWLLANEQVLNDMNVFPVPDGDTGTNMASTLSSVVRAVGLEGSPEDLSSMAKNAANAALLGARGNSGVILSQIVQGISDGIGEKKRLSSLDLALSLKKACDRAYASIQSPKEGTILTVLRESAEAAYRRARTEPDILIVLDTLLGEARRSLLRTPDLLPALKEAGVVDAGAMGFVLILEGIDRMLKKLELPDLSAAAREGKSAVLSPLALLSEHFGYCTEFFLHPREPVDASFREKLSGLGDSLVYAEAAGAVKVHIHTKHPGLVLEEAGRHGMLSRIKIDNMDEQHGERIAPAKKKEIGIVAVAQGEGVRRILESLDCDAIVTGGQTMNPSVDEIVNVIRGVNAENIILMPNNPNIIFAAEQAARMLETPKVFVLPTRTVPEGFAAMLAFNPEASPEENLRVMGLAGKKVRTGEVIRAAKDTTMNGVEVKNGDIIAIREKQLTGPYGDCLEAVASVAESLVEQDSELVTVLYSEEADECTESDLEKTLHQRWPNLEVEVHHGGQPYYSFIVSVE